MEGEQDLETEALAVWLGFLERTPSPKDEDFERLCAAHPALRARLQELRAEYTARNQELTRALTERLAQLARPIARGSRFRREGVLAHGGMGVIHRAHDLELNRTLALKELSLGPAAEHAREASRFLEEAQITAQLDHPGILPVHELGVDKEGRVFFAMKLVEGRDLRAILELVRDGREGWTQTRALGVLLKVCEAVAYAHSKGVIHRDLKPGNVMVGSFGEVYVMDWGLARALGRTDVHDIRLKLDCGLESVRTERRDEREEMPDSPLVTMDGVVIGTPAYMSPEQARGEIHLLSPRSDVYSIGAMLYELLAGSTPFVPRGARVSKHTVLARVVEGPPTPISRLNPRAPVELVAIAEKAMARASEQRYPDTISLGEDLRAYLEHRVVRAHQTGAWAELSKWIERNRALAAAVAVAIVALVAGLIASSSLYVEARENERRATANEQRAREQALAADLRAEEVLRLSAFQRLDDLVTEAERLWPISPALEGACTTWLAQAAELTERLPSYETKLADFRARGRPSTEAGVTTWSFATEEDRWWHNQLAKLVDELHAFTDEKTGLDSSGISPVHGWGVKRRLEACRTLGERTLTGAEARARWAEASAAIADVNARPWYRGLVLAPQLGLLPLGPDPDSGLWEFAHLESGEPAVRGTDGNLILEDDTGLVFVLLPGGSFQMGAQRSNATKPNLDSRALSDEYPVHEVRLSPFFLSKYEMTQGQWERITGDDPTSWALDMRLPIDQVSWTQCERVCARLGLALPSEAQWEYAARAGTDTPWWSGADLSALPEVGNMAERSYKAGGARDKVTEDWDDGAYGPARVGRYAPNPFGLYDVAGNLWEWCLDWSHPYAEEPLAPLDPVASTPGDSRVMRGGGFDGAAEYARSSQRFSDSPENTDYNLGLRPARKVQL